MTYREKLESRQWTIKREEILKLANFKCESCGTSEPWLEIHHTAYIPRSDPWDNTPETLMALCPSCHDQRQSVEDSLRMVVGKITRMMSQPQLDVFFWDIASLHAKSDHSRQLELQQSLK